MSDSEGLTNLDEVVELKGEPVSAARGAILNADSFSELEALLSRVPLGVAFLDDALRIDRANDGFAKVMGVPPGDLRGQTIDTVLPFVADVLRPVLERVCRTGEAVPEFEFAAAPNDSGARHWLSAVVPIHRLGSRATRIGFIVRDITDRIAARERVVRSTRQRESIYALATALVEAETPQEVVRSTIQHTTSAFGAAAIRRLAEFGIRIRARELRIAPPRK